MKILRKIAVIIFLYFIFNRKITNFATISNIFPVFMDIFIDDKLIRLIESKNIPLYQENDFDLLIDARLEPLNLSKFQGHVIVLNATHAILDKFFKLIQQQESGYLSVVFVVEDLKNAERKVKSLYKVVKAAGGLVFNKFGEVLLIYRLDKWDLPKGKKDDGEKSKETALREVEEECNIKVRLGDKVCTTWHTYSMGNNKILKSTKWYTMACLDDSKMKPQKEEGIDEVRWMDAKELQRALLNSYSSIRYVFEQYNKLFFDEK